MASPATDSDAREPRPLGAAWWREGGPLRAERGPREILRFQPGHRLTLFHRGREAIGAMLEAIEAAERHVHLETYILRADETGRRVLAALEGRARAGVGVRVIFDAVGSRGLDRRALARLRGCGAEIAEYNPPSRWLWRFRPRQRDHRKLLIVDGRVGFLGSPERRASASPQLRRGGSLSGSRPVVGVLVARLENEPSCPPGGTRSAYEALSLRARTR